MLSNQLLYKFERPQYSEVCEHNCYHSASVVQLQCLYFLQTVSSYPDTTPCQIYGASHLLRMFGETLKHQNSFLIITFLLILLQIKWICSENWRIACIHFPRQQEFAMAFGALSRILAVCIFCVYYVSETNWTPLIIYNLFSLHRYLSSHFGLLFNANDYIAAPPEHIKKIL